MPTESCPYCGGELTELKPLPSHVNEAVDGHVVTQAFQCIPCRAAITDCGATDGQSCSDKIDAMVGLVSEKNKTARHLRRMEAVQLHQLLYGTTPLLSRP